MLRRKGCRCELWAGTKRNRGLEPFEFSGEIFWPVTNSEMTVSYLSWVLKQRMIAPEGWGTQINLRKIYLLSRFLGRSLGIQSTWKQNKTKCNICMSIWRVHGANAFWEAKAIGDFCHSREMSFDDSKLCLHQPRMWFPKCLSSPRGTNLALRAHNIFCATSGFGTLINEGELHDELQHNLGV